MKKHHSEQDAQDRRSFLKTTISAAAGVSAAGLIKTPVYGQSQSPSVNVKGANDRIAVAFIGTGSQGKAHIRSVKSKAKENNVVLAAVCDVYQKRLDEAKTMAGVADGDAVGDHRKLMERKDIDAVIVATVDNWHADVAVDALNAGKHVYGEKPLARYLDEGFRVYDAVKKTGKVFVIGSQYCVDAQYHKAAEWIKAGKLGPLVWAQGSYCRNNPRNDEWQYPIDKDVSESNLDWNRWVGNAKKIPFNPQHYFSWHKYYAYNSGILGNLLSHVFLPLLLATANPEFPRRVCCTGTKKVSTERDITDTTHLLAEMPSGLTFCVAGSTVNEQGLTQMIRGRQGTLTLAFSQNKLEFKPERPFVDELDAEEFNDPSPGGKIDKLEKNFFDCIRSGAEPAASIDLAIRAHTILSLAEQSERTGLMLYFDPKTRKITSCGGKEIPSLSYDSNAPMTT
jgi:predicted dehydrogenase